MRNTRTLAFVILLFGSTAAAQTVAIQPGAEQTIQPSQTSASSLNPPQSTSELKVAAGTPIEIEVAYTVNSLDLKPGERISFRVLVPIVVDGVTVVEEGALVTARVTQSKRGGHWGKAGKLAWSMEDVVATDSSRIPLAPETGTRNDKLWSFETKPAKGETKMGSGRVTGTSHVAKLPQYQLRLEFFSHR